MAGTKTVLVALILVLSTLSLASAECTKVKGNNTFCIELDESTSFAWTAIGGNVVNTSMYCVPAKPFGWCGWGISPNGGLMAGSSALCGYSNNKQDTTQTSVTQFFLQDQRTLIPNQGDLTVQSTAIKYDSDGNLYLYGIIEIDPTQTLWLIWARGVGIVTYDPPQLVQHRSTASARSEINFQAGTTAGTQVSGLDLTYIKNHAVLVTVGFGILMPIGFLFSRHFRVIPGADPAWFFLHIVLMVSGWLLGVIGFGYGIQLYEWSNNVKQAHFELGIAVVVTATLQLLTPIVKPDKDSKIRLYWNLVHWAFGYTTIIISIINIYWGFTITTGPEYPDQQYDTWRWNYSIFLWVWAGVFVLLEAVSWLFWLKNRKEGEEEKEVLKTVEP